MKHNPFQSIYRENFEVVEQRLGKQRLFPHTEQLPLLIRALNLEFYGALPGHIARVDNRADGFHKYLLRSATMMFTGVFNRVRTDELRLCHMPTSDLVSKVALVQQVSESHPLGLFHRFRFYGGDGFFPEIRLSGKRLAFSDHVLRRFSARVPNKIGDDLSNFLLVFYGTPFVSMPVASSRAFVLQYYDSILAFTYKETEDEFFVTTCLTPNEMNSLQVELPPHTMNLHFGETFVRPKIRTWIPTQWMAELHNRWRNKVPMPPPANFKRNNFRDWKHLALFVKDAARISGHGPGSRLSFLDDIPGPAVMESKPGQAPMAFDELAAYKIHDPGRDWDAEFAALDGQAEKK